MVYAYPDLTAYFGKQMENRNAFSYSVSVDCFGDDSRKLYHKKSCTGSVESGSAYVKRTCDILVSEKYFRYNKNAL